MGCSVLGNRRVSDATGDPDNAAMPFRVLLVSLNTCTVPDPVFPLGLACIDAALRRAGHITRWVDAQVNGSRLAGIVAEFRPDCIGLSLRNIDDVLIRTRETFFDELAVVCTGLRRLAGCPLVLGGSGFSIFPRELLTLSGADYGIQGAGEDAFVRLLERLQNMSNVNDIPGLVYRDKTGVVTANPPGANGRAQVLEPRDWPDEIRTYYLETGGMLNLQTHRGCAHACCYCTYPLLEGRRHRRRPGEDVAEDLARLAAAGATYAFIVDSIFNASPAHVAEVCEAVIRRNLKIAWSCFLRPQHITPELARLMARAGLRHAELGSDRFSDTVLGAYRKHLTFEDLLRSTEALRAAEVDCCHFVICGGPGETWETLEEGFANAARLGDVVVLPTVGMRIYPGTALHRQAMGEGRVDRDNNLLRPVYYLAPGLDEAGVFARLAQQARQARNWMTAEVSPKYREMVARLRRRGHVAPVWGYFALLQRLVGAA